MAAMTTMMLQQSVPLASATASRSARAVTLVPSFGAQRPSLRPAQAPRRLQVVSATPQEQRAQEAAEDAQVDIEKVVDDLKERWENTENKTSVVLYGVGALFTLWLASTIVGAVNHVPILPKLLELVGLGYTGWFTYRYLLFKSSREELIEDVEELKKKIAGAVED